MLQAFFFFYYDVTQSFSQKANPYDISVAESFFAGLRKKKFIVISIKDLLIFKILSMSILSFTTQSVHMALLVI